MHLTGGCWLIYLVALDDNIFVADEANLVSFPASFKASGAAGAHRNKYSGGVATVGAGEVDIHHGTTVIFDYNFPIFSTTSLMTNPFPCAILIPETKNNYFYRKEIDHENHRVCFCLYE